MLFADKSLKKLENIVNQEISHVQNWLFANKLSINIDKSNIIFHPYQKRLNYDVNLTAFDHKTNTYNFLEQKDYARYLGVLIDKYLTWKYHISHIASKISKTIGIIARLRHFVPTNTLLNIYRSLIQPHLLYGINAWEMLQKIYRETYYSPKTSYAPHLF